MFSTGTSMDPSFLAIWAIQYKLDRVWALIKVSTTNETVCIDKLTVSFTVTASHGSPLTALKVIGCFAHDAAYSGWRVFRRSGSVVGLLSSVSGACGSSTISNRYRRSVGVATIGIPGTKDEPTPRASLSLHYSSMLLAMLCLERASRISSLIDTLPGKV